MSTYILDKEIRFFARKTTKKIILSQLPNFIRKGYPINNNIIFGSSQLTAPIWEYYYEKEVKKEDMAANRITGIPYHYLIEQVGNDFQITIGAPEYVVSPFIYDMINNDIIPFEYNDSIVIAIAENMTFERPESRLWDILNFRLIVPLFNRLKYSRHLGVDDILYIDEIINYLNPKLDDSMFNIVKSTYFDRVAFERSFTNFNRRLSNRS